MWPELLLGIAGPLASGVTWWKVTKRVSRRRPERSTAVMIRAFGVKIVFFCVYVALVLKVPRVEPVPFVLSFTACFIVVLGLEAFRLSRITA